MSDPREKEYRATRRDNPAQFLRELRELRNQARLEQSELAARAHYPIDVVRAAEAGPGLPDLPVLSAYVRGCGGPLSEWEERWRAVTGSPASPILMARAAGCSDAADAGARIGAASAAADSHDPDRVIAALGRVADGMAAAATSSSPSPSLSSASLSEAAASVTSDSVLPDGALSNGAVSNSAVSGAATGASVWDPAPKRGGGSAWDSGPPAARTDREAGTGTPQPAAPQSAVPQPAAPRPVAADALRIPAQSGAPLAAAQQPISGPGQRRLSRAALAALVAVALLLIAAVLVVFG